MAPLCACKGRLIIFHDDNGDDAGKAQRLNVRTTVNGGQSASCVKIQTASISKMPLPVRRCDRHLITGSLGHPSQHLNGISIGSAVFAGLTIVTGRQTDRPRYSVRIAVVRI